MIWRETHSPSPHITVGGPPDKPLRLTSPTSRPTPTPRAPRLRLHPCRRRRRRPAYRRRPASPLLRAARNPATRRSAAAVRRRRQAGSDPTVGPGGAGEGPQEPRHAATAWRAGRVEAYGVREACRVSRLKAGWGPGGVGHGAASPPAWRPVSPRGEGGRPWPTRAALRAAAQGPGARIAAPPPHTPSFPPQPPNNQKQQKSSRKSQAKASENAEMQ